MKTWQRPTTILDRHNTKLETSLQLSIRFNEHMTSYWNYMVNNTLRRLVLIKWLEKLSVSLVLLTEIEQRTHVYTNRNGHMSNYTSTLQLYINCMLKFYQITRFNQIGFFCRRGFCQPDFCHLGFSWCIHIEHRAETAWLCCRLGFVEDNIGWLLFSLRVTSTSAWHNIYDELSNDVTSLTWSYCRFGNVCTRQHCGYTSALQSHQRRLSIRLQLYRE